MKELERRLSILDIFDEARDRSRYVLAYEERSTFIFRPSKTKRAKTEPRGPLVARLRARAKFVSKEIDRELSKYRKRPAPSLPPAVRWHSSRNRRARSKECPVCYAMAPGHVCFGLRLDDVLPAKGARPMTAVEIALVLATEGSPR